MMRSFWCAGPLLAAVVGLSNASSLTPPILPLMVRNPYLSAWMQSAREAPWSDWPMFWTGQNMGMAIMARVAEDETVYPLLGRPQDALLPVDEEEKFNVSFPAYLGASYDASTTNLTYNIPSPALSNSSSARLVLSFLSPITPTSTLRQAIPASYIKVYVEGDFKIDIYIDMNGQWVSGDRGSHITWQFDQRSLEEGHGLKSFQWHRTHEQLLTEYLDRAEWGSCHLTATEDFSHEAGPSSQLRHRFARHGSLQNNVDRHFRGIMDREPAFAFATTFELGENNTASETILTVAHVQDPVVQFAAARGRTFMRPLWASFFSSVQDLLTFHYFDYPNAAKLSGAYSAQLAKDAYKSGAEDYVDILALSARQVLGATSFSGTPEDPILFLKEISSNGNFQTIDVIFPSFPFFLYTNPRWLAYLLEPLIEHMLSGQYPNDYAMHDLGAHFPNATGHPDGRDEYMPVEECGNILMMGLAVANSLRYENEDEAGSVWAAGGSSDMDNNPANSAFALTRLSTQDGISYIDDRWGGGSKGEKQAQKWVTRSYKLWKQWTGYLVEYSLLPANQLCTDDFAGWLALQTNLALKGIIGIRAMSGIAELIGEDADAKHYRDIAYDYIDKWEGYGISRDGTHAKLAYDWYGSWTTIYNIYGDALLCFHLDEDRKKEDVVASDDSQKPIHPPKGNATGFVPHHIYKMQSDWYYAVRQKYGLPLDSRHLYTKTDWEFFAMSVASKKTRSTILELVATWVNETSTDRPLTDLHNTEGTGHFPGPNFFARPVIGGHFAFLTLERACGGRAMQGLSFLEAESSPERLEEVRLAAQSFGSEAGPSLEL